jgi:hypothetical protein
MGYTNVGSQQSLLLAVVLPTADQPELLHISMGFACALCMQLNAVLVVIGCRCSGNIHL